MTVVLAGCDDEGGEPIVTDAGQPDAPRVRVDQDAGVADANAGYGSSRDASPEDTAPEVALERGLIIHYRFDDGVGAVVRDSSGLGLDAVVVEGDADASPHSAPLWGEGAPGFGGGVRLDGIDDWIKVPAHAALDRPALSGALSISTWVRIETAGITRDPVVFVAQAMAAEPRGEFALEAFTGILIGRIGTAIGSAEAVPLHHWVHVALTCDGAVMHAYLDGKPGPASPCRPPTASSGRALTIGAGLRADAIFGRLKGELDELRIYDRALSPVEVARLAEHPVALAAGLRVHYQFDEGDGNTVADRSPLARHGRVVEGQAATAALHPGPAWGQGRPGAGAALRLDGLDDWVTAGPQAEAPAAFGFPTLCVWVKLEPPQDPRRPMTLLQGSFGGTETDAFSLALLDKILVGRLGRGQISAFDKLPFGRWTSICFGCDKARRRLHVDGIEVGQPSQGDKLALQEPALTIGAALRSDASTEHMKGLIDDVRVYDRCLSTGELAALASQ